MSTTSPSPCDSPIARFQRVRRVRHRLDAAGDDDLRRPGGDGIGGVGHGGEAGPAHPIDGLGRHGHGKSAPSAAWRATFIPLPACSTIPSPRRPRGPTHVGAAERLTDDDRAQLRRRQILESAADDPIGVRHADRMTAALSKISISARLEDVGARGGAEWPRALSAGTLESRSPSGLTSITASSVTIRWTTPRRSAAACSARESCGRPPSSCAPSRR